MQVSDDLAALKVQYRCCSSKVGLRRGKRMQAHRGEIPLFPPALQEANISLAKIPKPAAEIAAGQARTILNHPCCYTHNW